MNQVFKQSHYHSCLVASLLMASGLGQELESEIFDIGDKQTDYTFYMDSIMAAFNKVTGKKLVCLVDNQHLTDIFKKSLSKQKDDIEIRHEPISAELVSKLVQGHPVVVHVDDNFLGDYSHCSHFVTVAKQGKDHRFEILDPWDAKVKYLTPKQLDDAFQSLKNHIKMAPEIIYINSKQAI